MKRTRIIEQVFIPEKRQKIIPVYNESIPTSKKQRKRKRDNSEDLSENTILEKKNHSMEVRKI